MYAFLFYGQEKNLTSSSIARMNMFLHGVEDFRVARGDTLRQPAFFDADGLQRFDCVIANPPFSLKEWGVEEWASDPYGRNLAGVPPQGNADMAWVQHMITSMKSDSGRMAVVLPTEPSSAKERRAASGRHCWSATCWKPSSDWVPTSSTAPNSPPASWSSAASN